MSTQLAGNPMMALCAVWVSHSRPRKVPEGGFRNRSLAAGERLLEGSWKRYSVLVPKVLCTFPWPVLNDDVINCPFGACCSVRACHLFTSQSQTTNLLKEQAHATWRISSESTLELRLRERENVPPLEEPFGTSLPDVSRWACKRKA